MCGPLGSHALTSGTQEHLCLLSDCCFVHTDRGWSESATATDKEGEVLAVNAHMNNLQLSMPTLLT